MPRTDLTEEERAARIELRRKAQAAAAAAGKDWKTLTKEERIEFRKQVRRQERRGQRLAQEKQARE